MTIAEKREKILNDDEFLLGEIGQLILYYKLKHTLRWGHDNDSKDASESVADHIYALHVLSDYLLPLYPELNALRVKQLITWHDMAETLVDDTITNYKTDQHREAETAAEDKITSECPQHLREIISSIFAEYNEQETQEARFVKAIDKIEPNLHMYFLSQYSKTTRDMLKTRESDWTSNDCKNHQIRYVQEFDVLLRIYEFVVALSRQAGYYTDTP